MRILVAGGTGRAGRAVTARAVRAGHQVRALSRTGADTSGAARAEAVETVAGDLRGTSLPVALLAGVDAVVDVSNVVTPSYRRAARFFRAGTENLVAAERAAGVRHHVVLSVVGADRFPGGYYRAKVEQEEAGARACVAAGITHTVARVTQFHDFAAMTYASARLGPVVLAPRLHLRPVHLDDVADHLLDLLAHPAPGRAAELSGPGAEDLDVMVRRFAALQPMLARILALPLPGAYGRANRARVLSPTGGRRGKLGFETWLEQHATADRGSGSAK